METLGVIGNISRDQATYPDGRCIDLLGGAALHVALAAARAGLPTAPIAVIGRDLSWIGHDTRLGGVDLSCVEVTSGESCSFQLSYDSRGQVIGTQSSFGAAALLTDHALEVLGQHRVYHVCCRRPLDVPAVLNRLVITRTPFSVDFHLASASGIMSAAEALLPHASIVFVNAAEFTTLSTITDPGRLKAVVISNGPRPVSLLRLGQVKATVLPPVAEAIEVTGAGDTLAGAFLGAASCGHDDHTALRLAVVAAAAAVGGPGLVIAPR